VTVPRKYAVIGDPVAQSLSPLIHAAWMRDLRINATYEAVHVPDSRGDVDAIHSALDQLAAKGFAGLNVTAPHKEMACRAAGTVSPLARKLNAANTLSFADGSWAADNTDVEGFALAMDGLLGAKTVGHAVLIGAGGAARACAVVLAERAESVTVLNRTRSRAETLIDGLIGPKGAAEGLESLPEVLESADFVVNTVSAGHSGEGFSWPAGRGRPLLDISYGRAAALNLEPAQAAGWCTTDGLGMLVGQARAAFRTWFGLEPDLEAGLSRARDAIAGRSS
jgi:shikimate dehydrogenase